MLELKNINFSIKGEEQNIDILKDINLKFDKGITVITGQNGSGKSTLIKLIMGINNASGGKIMYKRKDISKLGISERANLGFTLAFQQPIRFKGIKVKDLLDIASSRSNKLSDACEYLSKVIYRTAASVADGMFENCILLSEIEFLNNVTEFGDCAFKNCFIHPF